MLENLYTTKMSTDKKKLQNRFTKIRSKTGRVSKTIAAILFIAILLTIACAATIIAINTSNEDYTMTESEFAEFVSRPIGAVMADIDYANDSKLVFHYGEGLFIIHRQATLPDPRLSSELDLVINLKKLNLAYNQQGSTVLDVKISKDGQYAYLSTIGPADEIKSYDKYIVALDNGAVKKGTIPESTELFVGISDTFETVQNPIGWYSNNCIVSRDKIYYLTSETGMIKDIQLITVNKADNEIKNRYIFELDVNATMDVTTRNKSYAENSEMVVRNFFTAFEQSDFSAMKTLVTNEFIAQGYIDDAYGMCYGMTKSTLETLSKANTDEFLKIYLKEPEHAQITLSENDIELLKAHSEAIDVYTVIVMAESNIKGETNPPYGRFLNVICKKQDDGGWLVHKLY